MRSSKPTDILARKEPNLIPQVQIALQAFDTCEGLPNKHLLPSGRVPLGISSEVVVVAGIWIWVWVWIIVSLLLKRESSDEVRLVGLIGLAR